MRVACTTQKTNEFFSARVGNCTASRMGDAMRKLQRASFGDKKKGDWHGDHVRYVRELAREMITGIPAWHRFTPEMQYGVDHEAEAREAYVAHTGQQVEQTGVIIHPLYNYLGCSPDGLIGLDGGCEFKVPLLATHMDNLINDEIPEMYLPQMYTCMLCCGEIFTGPVIDGATGILLSFDGGFIRPRQWWDFCSFCPKDPDDDERMMLPDDLRLFVKRLYADEAKFREIEEAATQTIEEAVALVQKLSQRRHPQAVEMPKEMLLSAGEEPIF